MTPLHGFAHLNHPRLLHALRHASIPPLKSQFPPILSQFPYSPPTLGTSSLYRDDPLLSRVDKKPPILGQIPYSSPNLRETDRRPHTKCCAERAETDRCRAENVTDATCSWPSRTFQCHTFQYRTFQCRTFSEAMKQYFYCDARGTGGKNGLRGSKF